MSLQSKTSAFLRISSHVNGRVVMTGFDTDKTLKALSAIQTDLEPESPLYIRAQTLKEKIIYGKYQPPRPAAKRNKP